MVCKECVDAGYVWDGEPAGKEAEFGGVKAYVANPAKDTNKAVLLLSDVFGYDKKNARLYADRVAQAGFIAILPDYLKGDHLEDFSKAQEWIARHPLDEGAVLIDSVVEAVTKDLGVTSLGVVGFCWGGYYAVHLGAKDKVKAIVVNHGSRLTLEKVEALRQPALFNCNADDQQIPDEFRAQIWEALKAKDNSSAVNLFYGVKHGFSMRGDEKDPVVSQAVKAAFVASVDFFAHRL